MFKILKDCKSIEGFEATCLRKSLKDNKNTSVDDFCEKFKELKIEGQREKSLTKNSLITSNYIGKESMSRKRFQEQRSRSRSRYRSGSRGRSFSRDRLPSFRRDSYSQTRAVNNKSDFRSNHGRDFERCIGCPCKACKNHREVVYNIKESSEKQGEMNVSLRSSNVDAARSY